MRGRRFLCLWFPNWPIQRLVVAEPDLRKKHLVLFRRDPRKGQRVAAASPLAIRDGVGLEMPVSEVKQLLRNSGRKREIHRSSHRLHPRTQYHQLARQGDIGFQKKGSQAAARVESPAPCRDPLPLEGADLRGEVSGRGKQNKTNVLPVTCTALPASSQAPVRPSPKEGDGNSFFILEHDPVADREAMEKLVDSLHCFSPIVGIEQTEAPESCFLDVTGLGALFGDEASLRKRVSRYLKDAGYIAFSAIANTPGMAWGMAHYHRSSAPDVCDSISDETLRHEFRKLPVGALRLHSGTQNTLARLGVERVDQLLKIPRTHLASRFGDEVAGRIDQAFGRVEEPIVARHLPAEFEASQFIEFPTRDRETIGIIVSRLLKQICDQLVANQKGALQWRVRLDCLEAPAIEFEVNLFQPTATVEHVLQLVELQLESVLKPHLRRKRLRKESAADKLSQVTSRKRLTRTRTVTSIQVQEILIRVTSCVLLVHRQRELFDESPRLDRQELAYLINHLTSRLGQESVVYPTLQAGAQPELSFRYKPLVDPKRMRSRRRENIKTYSHRQARPLRLLEEPVVLDGSSKKIGAPDAEMPGLFRYRGALRQVVAQWGPERIETSWWRGPTIRRDYWRIEVESGQQFWIYFDLRRKQWFSAGRVFRNWKWQFERKSFFSGTPYLDTQSMMHELHCKTNFSFLTGASHADELVHRAIELGYSSLAVTDQNTLAGVVRAYGAIRDIRKHGIVRDEERDDATRAAAEKVQANYRCRNHPE